MDISKSDLFDKTPGLFKFFLGLPRKAHDDIGRDRRMLIIAPDALTPFPVLRGRIMAVHAAQRGIASALERQMEMRAQFVHPRKSLHKFLTDDTRLQRPQPDPLDTVHFVHPLEQFNQRLAF